MDTLFLFRHLLKISLDKHNVTHTVALLTAATAADAASEEDEDEDDCDGCQDPDGRGGATLPVQVQEAAGAGSHEPGAAVTEGDLLKALLVHQTLAAVESFDDPTKFPLG